MIIDLDATELAVIIDALERHQTALCVPGTAEYVALDILHTRLATMLAEHRAMLTDKRNVLRRMIEPDPRD